MIRRSRPIARALNVEEALVQETLEFLVDVGLIERSKKGFSPGAVRLHLPHDSSDVSISMDDFHIIRDMLLKAIDQAKKKIRDSKEETLASFNLDFFALASSEETGTSKGSGQ
jgi:predicted transcriptional regulator